MGEKISVIMGVYNGESTVQTAINSILNQTFKDWEFIICDDGSTDKTFDILSEYKEKYAEKFIILKNNKNLGLAYSLNKCLAAASGKYIARMDSDDISAEERFAIQLDYLEENPSIDLVGSSMQRFDEDGLNDVIKSKKHPEEYSLREGVPFNHATILTYKYVYDELNGYTVSKNTERAEDLELWFRFFKLGFKGENIQAALYLVREDAKAIKRRTRKSRLRSLIIRMQGFKLLGFPRSWCFVPIVSTITKSLIPFRVQEIYRNYQSFKYKENFKR